MTLCVFEPFRRTIDALPAKGVLRAIKLQRRMIEDDLLHKRDLDMVEAKSVLCFCHFVEAIASDRNASSCVVPASHVAFYQNAIGRLIEAGELALGQLERSLLKSAAQFMQRNCQDTERVLPHDRRFYDMTDVIQLEQASRANQRLPLRRDPLVSLCKWLGRLIRFQVPVGYEDETGFHYGEQPAPVKFSQPAYVQTPRGKVAA
jgi:hypothetical protein